MRFLFSYSKISKSIWGVSYKVFLINHTACMLHNSILVRRSLSAPFATDFTRKGSKLVRVERKEGRAEVS